MNNWTKLGFGLWLAPPLAAVIGVGVWLAVPAFMLGAGLGLIMLALALAAGTHRLLRRWVHRWFSLMRRRGLSPKAWYQWQ